MLGHGAGIGYTGPGPTDNFSLVTGSSYKSVPAQYWPLTGTCLLVIVPTGVLRGQITPFPITLSDYQCWLRMPMTVTTEPVCGLLL